MLQLKLFTKSKAAKCLPVKLLPRKTKVNQARRTESPTQALPQHKPHQTYSRSGDRTARPEKRGAGVRARRTYTDQGNVIPGRSHRRAQARDRQIGRPLGTSKRHGTARSAPRRKHTTKAFARAREAADRKTRPLPNWHGRRSRERTRPAFSTECSQTWKSGEVRSKCSEVRVLTQGPT